MHAHDDTSRWFDRRAQLYLRRQLPGFCTIFGIGVLAAGMWSFMAQTGQTPASLGLRLALVAAAFFAYAGRTPAAFLTERVALVYVLHAMALAATGLPLADGLRQGMPVLFVWMIAAGLVEPRPRQCLRILAPAALLYAAAGALLLPPAAALAVLIASATAPVLAIGAGRATLHLRNQAWLRERELLRACRYDSLSGALSRAYLTTLAQRDMALAGRNRRQFAVAMLDIDHFKRINDSHGHAVGDAAIRALVGTCMQTLRAGDYVGRLGGEEFVCVLPDAGAEEALTCMERLRQSFAAMRIPGAPAALRCTVSIGIAVYHGQPDWETLLREADAALYRAKAEGRNRVVAMRAEAQPCGA